MELDELRQMNAGDLRIKEREAREEIFRLGSNCAPISSTIRANYRRARKELARILTLLRQKSGPAGAGAAARTKASDAASELNSAWASVVSAKMAKTVVVQVDRLVEHPLYGKRLRQRTRFMAHDERGECHEGDRVLIIESPPISRRKRWRVSRVLKRAAG